MAYFAVHYTYSDDTAELDRVRPQHRAFLTVLAAGPLVASGPYVDADEPSALLILKAGSPTEVAEALDADPFWEAGLIDERHIQEWNPLIGILAGP